MQVAKRCVLWNPGKVTGGSTGFCLVTLTARYVVDGFLTGLCANGLP